LKESRWSSGSPKLESLCIRTLCIDAVQKANSGHPATLWQWRRSTLEEMNKALKLKESVAWMTLGWLAREDKIEIEQAGKTEKLSLK
jgi:hypothetical protein